MSEHAKKLIEMAKGAKRIVISAHYSPDDDSVGSCLGMYSWVTKNLPNKEVKILYNTPENDRFKFLALYKNIEWVEDLAESITDGDFLILLDGTPLSRFFRKPENFDKTKFTTFCIDHHILEGNEHDYLISEPDAASCSELIAKHFYSDEELKDKDAAEAMINGIVGDTGSFAYVESKSSDVFIQAKRIIDASNFRIEDINLKSSKIKEREFEVIALLSQNMKLVQIQDNLTPATITYLSREDAKKYDPTTVGNGYHIFISKFLRYIEGSPWGFVLIPDETQNKYKISMRSSAGGPDVQHISSEYLNGGGHTVAAGGQFPIEESKTTEEMLEKIIKTLNGAEIKML